MAAVHEVFHVSMLKKCIGDPESIFPIEGLSVKDNISYEEVEIIYRQAKRLRKHIGGLRKSVMEKPPS